VASRDSELDALRGENADLRRVVDLLGSLIYEDFPEGMTLSQIAETWGHGTPEQLGALRCVEAERGSVD
jgi:hypothetical protein